MTEVGCRPVSWNLSFNGKPCVQGMIVMDNEILLII